MSIFAISNHLKRIVKSTFFITAGGTLPLLSSVVLLIPYTDNLNTADYGALAIYISFALFVQILMNYAVDSYLSVHYYDHHEDETKLKHFLSSISGIVLSIGLLFIGLFSLLGYFLFPIIFKDTGIEFFPWGFMSVLTGFFNAWFRTYVNIQVFADRPIKYFLFGLFNFVVTIAISVILIYQFPFTLVGPMWGRLLSGVLIFLLTFIYGLKEFGIKFKFNLLPEIKSYATPVVLFSLLTWVLGYINNYILTGLATTSDVGVYDFALKCTLVIEYAGLGITGAINPRIYQLWKKSDQRISTPEENRYYHVYSALNILIIASNILLLPFIIKLFVSNEQYYASIQYLPVLCAAFVFKGLYTMYINPILFYKKTKALPVMLIVTAIVQIVSGIVFIKLFGLWGAVWSYFLVRPIQIILLRYAAREIFTFNYNSFKLFWVPLIYVAGVITMWQIQMPENFRYGIQFALAIVLISVAYRNEIKDLPGLFGQSKLTP